MLVSFFYKNVLQKSTVDEPTTLKNWERTKMEHKVGLEQITYILGSCAKHTLLEQLFLYILEKAVSEYNKL